MNDWTSTLQLVLLVLIYPFGGWLALRLIQVEKQVASINTRCEDRLERLNTSNGKLDTMDTKLDKTHDATIKIAAKLGVEL